jgi:hypothetical protein
MADGLFPSGGFPAQPTRSLVKRYLLKFRLFWLSDRPFVLVISIILAVASPILGQDDVTTRSGASAYGGAFITGPASNPLSFLNGDAYRTFASQYPYLIPDFALAALLSDQLWRITPRKSASATGIRPGPPSQEAAAMGVHRS